MIMDFESIYFIGIGGIGMSNLARYFMLKGKRLPVMTGRRLS